MSEGSTAARRVRHDLGLLSSDDLHLFNEGTHFRLFEKLGARLTEMGGERGVAFAVWAPGAERVAVVGDFNGWDPEAAPMAPVGSSGIWEVFLSGVERGACYKFHIFSRHLGYRADKTDPFGLYHEVAPRTGSLVWDLDYEWRDHDWMASRRGKDPLREPMSIYEIHLGSWMRPDPADGRMFLGYRELAPRLVEYLRDTGFTHVEFLPVMEHPFYGSWGYQVTGFFAPTSRYGSPQDFMYLIDELHRNGFGVILDWVPSHFPRDGHSIGYFDGTHLYEHADPRQGIHRDWDSFVFNYGRHEVRSFLLSSAHYWLDKYHADGLRVDAVASMLYLDYSRDEGEWIPNEFGGRENLEAISLLREMNETVFREHPGTTTIAEESTAWPMVSRPTYVGGLGFGMKWDMGWMHDTLEYFSKEPIHRRFHHNDLTFRQLYAFSENFVLPLSHDEVVHGKGSLLGKMPGDDWQKFANLRLLLGCMWAQPGKKLLFMGGEIGQWAEWNHDQSIEWHLLQYDTHAGVRRWVADLNRLYREERVLHETDADSDGFEWIDCNDSDASTLSFLRKGGPGEKSYLVACNFTPVPREDYLLGAPHGGFWREVLNSDGAEYGGSGVGNGGGVTAEDVPHHGREHRLTVTLPPLAILFFEHAG